MTHESYRVLPDKVAYAYPSSATARRLLHLRQRLLRMVSRKSSASSALPAKISDRVYEYRWLVERLRTRQGRLLDVGGGAEGVILSGMLSGLGWEVDVIDQNYHPITQQGVRFHVMDAAQMAFPEATFGAVSCISVLEHIGFGGAYGVQSHSLTADHLAVREMARVLRPGGLLCLSTVFGQRRDVPPIFRSYDRARLLPMFEGLEIENIEFLRPRLVEDPSGRRWRIYQPATEQEVAAHDPMPWFYSIVLIAARKPG
jgi:SAM-dependent methyltransferase